MSTSSEAPLSPAEVDGVVDAEGASGSEAGDSSTGDAAASTFVKLEPSPKKVNASILPLTFIEPVN
mgnify:CR=1 FL=1